MTLLSLISRTPRSSLSDLLPYLHFLTLMVLLTFCTPAFVTLLTLRPDRDMKIQFGISLEKLFSMPFFSCGATFVSVNSESLAKYTSLIKGKQMVYNLKPLRAHLCRRRAFHWRITRPSTWSHPPTSPPTIFRNALRFLQIRRSSEWLTRPSFGPCNDSV